jgi:hypothetical protein
MTKKTEVIVRELPKTGGLETVNVYLKNVPVFYPVVHEPKKRYQSEEREYSVTAFVDEAAKDELLDVVMLNKSFALVGKDKTSKPPRRIKFPLSSQVEEGKVNYDLVDGMYGFTVAKPEFSKKGNQMSVNVIDIDGNAFTENVGNGSVVNLKLFGYKNQEGQLVVTLDTLQIVEHVPYETKSSADSVDDDVLGVSYKVKKSEKVEKEVPKQSTKEPESEEDFDDSLPF